ncbi:hypothetical protein DYU05_07170 [Mucilaginibacter terrenus]|uniref:Uncharacterized protein n=1 Tax=Mucilaginibacter terrenus TaxID=2482727 RepID=A0A3E2NWS1_9SPHI|nr:hypothetical protein DYU05_07170 [Mucilaginibacter terrenus]
MLDGLINLFINLFTGNPSVVIVISTLVRASVFLLLLPITFYLIAIIINRPLAKTWHLVVVHLLIYIAIPVAIYVLKESKSSLYQVVLDLHTKPNLLISIYLPFILSSAIAIIFARRYKLVII